MLGFKKNTQYYIEIPSGTDWAKSVSNPSFSYFFRPRLHRQAILWHLEQHEHHPPTQLCCTGTTVCSLTMNQNWSQLKINQHFVLFFLRITFQPRSDPQSIVQLYKQLYQQKVPELPMVILVPKASVCIPSSPCSVAAVEQDHWLNWTRRGLHCHRLQPWRVSLMRQNEVTLMSILQPRHGYWAPSSCCLSKIICHFCSLHAEINIKTWLTKPLMRMNSFGPSSATKLSQKLHNH